MASATTSSGSKALDTPGFYSVAVWLRRREEPVDLHKGCGQLRAFA
jgi:hypothetical protein